MDGESDEGLPGKAGIKAFGADRVPLDDARTQQISCSRLSIGARRLPGTTFGRGRRAQVQIRASYLYS